jgi:iron complex outermembrane recepter protein
VTVDSFDNFSAMITRSIAAFGQTTYDVTPKTHLTGGLRYTFDDRSQEGSTIFHLSDGTTTQLPPVNDFPNASFKALTGRFTVAQDLSEDVMGYASYNRGYKAGTFNNLIVLANPGPALNPEHIDAFELGLKNDLLDHRLRMNFTTFYYKYTDLQVTVFQTINTALENAGSAKIKGLEGDAQLAVTGTTQLNSGFSWVSAKYKDFANAPLYTPIGLNTPNPANFGFGGFLISSLPGGAGGNTLPQSPKFSGFFGVNQHVAIIGGSSLDLNSTLSYQSRVYFTPDNLFSERGYANLGASAKWNAQGGRWDVTLWGRNLTDVHTFRAESVSGYINAGIPNEPRAYGVKVGAHF